MLRYCCRYSLIVIYGKAQKKVSYVVYGIVKSVCANFTVANTISDAHIRSDYEARTRPLRAANGSAHEQVLSFYTDGTNASVFFSLHTKT